jgi:hypothetical protein
LKTQDLPADGRALPESGSRDDAIRAAQNRVDELRRERGIVPRGGREEVPGREGAEAQGSNGAGEELRLTNVVSRLSYLVSPSSYYSENLTQHLRSAAARRRQREQAESRDWLTEIRNTKCEIRKPEPAPDALNSYLVSRISYFVKVYPDLALGMLRRKKAAAGRMYLLLRHHDAAGRGRLPVDEVTRLLTQADSPLRVCGRRQLANLLAAGEGVFWQRDLTRDGREFLRLHSAARAAAALGVDRLGGSPVAVPLAELTGTIGRVRAHLYAAFHSGRQRQDFLTGQTRPRGPISRAALQTLSAAAPNSQRNYERRAGVARKTAFAVGPRLGAADEHETAWARGRALFHYHDRQGRYGRPGAVYLAWQLPNEYTGPHATLPRGRMKRHNRALADLLVDGMTGNSERSSRRFFGTAKAACLARAPGEKYWRHGRAWLWQAEIRDTKFEIRMKEQEGWPAKQGSNQLLPSRRFTGHLPPASCSSSFVSRISYFVSGNNLHP